MSPRRRVLTPAKTAALELVVNSEALRLAAERGYIDAISDARAVGCSWREIAERVGQSHQSVHQWYTRRVARQPRQ